MSENVTANMSLPLLSPSQAQKHVTVNEAMTCIDGMVDLVLQSTTRATPPAAVVDGQCWAVPAGAINAWSGQGGKIAIASNGGWRFVQPRFGRRAMIADRGLSAIHDGSGWVIGAVTLGANGAGMMAGMASEDVTLGTGAAALTNMAIPQGVMVIGATARVVTAITGTLSTWALGHIDATNRFGSGLGKAAGSWSRGILSTPMTYWTPEQLRLTAVGGQFTGGVVRVAVHWWELRLPD